MTGQPGGAPAPPGGPDEALAAFDDAREDWIMSGFPVCSGPLWEAYVAAAEGYAAAARRRLNAQTIASESGR